jgi:hypothetical protein
MLFAAMAAAQPLPGAHAQMPQLVDKDAANWQHVSKQIWDFAELGYHEAKSSDLLQEQLEAAGFKVQAGVANEPTAFIASYGEGKPVLAILGEFDALPGLSQQTVPTRDPVKADGRTWPKSPGSVVPPARKDPPPSGRSKAIGHSPRSRASWRWLRDWLTKRAFPGLSTSPRKSPKHQASEMSAQAPLKSLSPFRPLEY